MAQQGLLQRLNSEIRLHRVGQPPSQNPPGGPVHDGDEREEALAHRDIGDVGAPDLVRPVDDWILQQIRPDLVLRVGDGRSELLINRPQPYLLHQTPNLLAPDDIARLMQMTRHLALLTI